MITPFDDYPIHQTPQPVAHPATGDPNHYDRYFFNGYRDDLYFGVAMALYPNRGVIDAAVSVVHDGMQRSLFASGRIPADRTRTEVGPIAIEVLEPLRSLRITAAGDGDAGGGGVRAELRFTSRTPAIEEPRQTIHSGSRLLMDYTRLTQWGQWSGWIESGGERIDLDAAPTLGTKDRSWGIRPVGAPTPAAPDARISQVFFLWAPLNFEDCATHLAVFERSDGERWLFQGAIIPVLRPGDPAFGDVPGLEHMAAVGYDIEWEPGLRRSRRAAVSLRPRNGPEHRIELEPLHTFRMRGIGYTHPTWGHGHWHGESAVGHEEHKVGELDSVDPTCIHVQQVVRARWGDRTGIGVLEQLAIGPHEPTGLTGMFDGAR